MTTIISVLQWLDKPVTDTLSTLELLWLVINIIGLGFSITNLADARRSLKASLSPPVDEVAIILASTANFIQLATCLIQAGFALLGIVSGFMPPSDSDSIGRIIIILGLIFFASLLTYVSYKVRYYRYQAFKAYMGEK